MGITISGEERNTLFHQIADRLTGIDIIYLASRARTGTPHSERGRGRRGCAEAAGDLRADPGRGKAGLAEVTLPPMHLRQISFAPIYAGPRTQLSPNGTKLWEFAASAVEFPVVAVAEGVDDRPRLSSWGGDPKCPPTCVTLEYGLCGMQVTTYPVPMWGEGEAWKDLVDFVKHDYGSGWWARNGPPLDFEGLEVVETTKIPTEKGYLEFKCYEATSVDEEEIRRREQAASEAEYRMLELALGDSLVEAEVIGGSELWSAGFEIVVSDAPLVALLSGSDIPPESLKLELVDDLLAFLCDR